MKTKYTDVELKEDVVRIALSFFLLVSLNYFLSLIASRLFFGISEIKFFCYLIIGISVIAIVAFFIYLTMLSEQEHSRNGLYFCTCCNHYVREYQFDFFKKGVCPNCGSDFKKMQKIPPEEEMDWMKKYPDFNKRNFKDCVYRVFKYEFQIKKNVKKIKKQAQAVAGTKSFMEYTKMDEKMSDIQKQVLEDTKQLEAELIKKVEKLIEIVPLYAVGRLAKILEILEPSRG
ncbi:hypothetical protein MXL46_11595 [Heyndrickxia sporothermodurans]|nr:hypothetical protein [Heyndrickxia sporothermodurans]MEB6549730.1 hypothetical protein [Heyndrickxia sporothermodurans]